MKLNRVVECLASTVQTYYYSCSLNVSAMHLEGRLHLLDYQLH